MKNFLKTFKAELSLTGTILIFALNYPVLKFVLKDISVFPLNLLRFIVAVVFLLFLLPTDLGVSFHTITVHARELALLAIIGYFLSPVLLLYGMNHSTASNAALILAGAPVCTTIVSWLIGNDVIGKMGWAALVISTVGLVIVTLPGASEVEPMGNVLFGNVLLLGDMILWGTYVSLQRNLLDRVDSVEASFWSLLIVLPVYLIGSIGSLDADRLMGLSVLNWLGILFSGALSMGLAHVWWNDCIKSFGPSTVSIYSNCIPLVAVFMGWILLGEQISVLQITGGVVLLVGVWMARHDRIQRTQSKKLGTPES